MGERPIIRFVWYLASAIVAVLLVTFDLKLHRANLFAPLCPPQNDSAALLSLCKSVQESGWPWIVDRLGAPGTAERMDYPLPEMTHWLFLRLVFWFTDSPFLAFNLWGLSSYPLVAVCCFAAMRSLGISRPIAFALAQIYTFVPFHVSRAFVHVPLAHYETVPLLMLVALWIVQGKLPLFRDTNGRWLANATTWAAATIAILTAVSSAYYAFFGCFALLIAGLYRALAEVSWRPLASSVGIIGIMVATGAICALPFVRYQQAHGANPAIAQRHANESEIYCLKLTQLVLPNSGHRVGPLAHITRTYNLESTNSNENRDSTLGLLGAMGLLGLMLRAVAPRGASLAGGLAILTVALLVLGMSGGLGGLFNLLVFPQIRCYNRLCIVIAFLALVAVGLSVDRWANSGRAWRSWFAAIGILLFGWIDVTSVKDVPPHVELQRDHNELVGFVQAMEASLPEGSMVFQLPAASYPEAGPTLQMPDYVHLICHAYSSKLRWSYGTNRNRRWGEWQRIVAMETPESMLMTLAQAGFRGIYVDRRGYADQGVALVSELTQRLGPPLVASKGGQQLLFAIAPVPSTTNVLTRPYLLLQDGFLPWSPTSTDEPRRARHVAQMRLMNPGEQAVAVELKMSWQRTIGRELTVAITSESLGVNLTASPGTNSESFVLKLRLPPGEHLVRFDASPRPYGLGKFYIAWTATNVRLEPGE